MSYNRVYSMLKNTYKSVKNINYRRTQTKRHLSTNSFNNYNNNNDNDNMEKMGILVWATVVYLYIKQIK
jgi:hypothetical protein